MENADETWRGVVTMTGDDGQASAPGWTNRGISFAAVSCGIANLHEVARLMMQRDDDGAHEVLGIIIRDLEAARRLL